MAQRFSNNAVSVLASGITAVATSLSVTPGDGAKFPALSGSDYFLATLYQISGSTEINHEIVKVTARATDTFTIARGQEGTTARAFSAADPIQMRSTAGTLAPIGGSLTTAGTAPAYTLTPTPAISAYVVGQRFRVVFHQLGTAGTLNISGLGAVALKQWGWHDNGSAQYQFDPITAQIADVEYDGTVFVVLGTSPLLLATTVTAGVLQKATAAEAIAGAVDTGIITPARLRDGLNATGSAPIYAARAWVNFNGTGTIAIRGSGNVSSITDLGVGSYTANFATAMPDANSGYSIGTCDDSISAVASYLRGGASNLTTTAISIVTATVASTPAVVDKTVVSIIVIR